MLDFVGILQRQYEFSKITFGSGSRVEGILDHISEEISEVRQNPKDIFEWIDIAILAADGAMRQGYSPEEFVLAWEQKLSINENRKWETSTNESKRIKHIKENL